MKPMLASPNKRPLTDLVNDEDMVAEPKIDGIRLLCGTYFTSRTGKKLFPPQPVVKAVAAANGVAPVGLDGELLGDVYWVFDLLHFDGRDMTMYPLSLRRKALERLFEHDFGPHLRLVPQAATVEDKQSLLKLVDDNQGEGTVWKSVRSLYKEGERSSYWLKVKRWHTIDALVVAVGTELNERGVPKANCEVAVLDGSKAVRIGRASTAGKPVVKVGSVVELKYLTLGADGALVQPELLRVRDDKLPSECGVDQLISHDKSCVETVALALH